MTYFPEEIRQALKTISMRRIEEPQGELTYSFVAKALNTRLAESGKPWQILIWVDKLDAKDFDDVLNLPLSRWPRFAGMTRQQILDILARSSLEEVVYFIRSDIAGGIHLSGKTIIISPSF